MSGKRLIHLPIYRKAVELQTMSRAIACCVSAKKDVMNMYSSNSLREEIAGYLLTDLALIRKQIALAVSAPSDDMRESSLHFINIMIRNLGSYCRGLEMDGMRERDYLYLMRSELISFRQSFRLWRKSLGS